MSKYQKQDKSASLRFYWIATVVLSILFHIGLLYYLSDRSDELTELNALPEDYIKLNVPNKQDAISEQEKEEDKNRRILETPLEKTAPVPDAEFLGQNDHRAKKLMKVKKQNQEKAADPGLPKQAHKSVAKKESTQGQDGSDHEMGKDVPVQDLKGEGSQDLTKKQKRGARSAYEKLLAESTESIAETEMRQGYMDHLDDMVEEGETIDMNTREYRFIGYFTGLRKAIELVWNYPNEAAQRGISGQVIVKFIILQDGKLSKVQVVESSGFAMLDTAIIDAIRLAAPYSPLPKGFQKERLVIRGAFSYVLGNY
jgi:TonB family protein